MLISEILVKNGSNIIKKENLTKIQWDSDILSNLQLAICQNLSYGIP